MERIKIICLIVEGWGGLAAYKSIIKGDFDKIELITKDGVITDMAKTDKRTVFCDLNGILSDIVICAGYSKIIKGDLLRKKKFINIHYSILPKYRGFHSTVWAILNDEDHLGLTIHRMNEFIDDGPIIDQYIVFNDKKSTSRYYMEHFNEWVETNLYKVVLNYYNGQIKEKIQDISQATWVGKRNIEDCKLDFNQTNQYIFNFFRALVEPYPLPFIRMRGTKMEYRITKYELLNRKINTHVGRILNIDYNGIYVSTKEGYIILKELRNNNNEIVSFDDFKIGQYLEL